MHILREVEIYLRKSGTPPTAFGRAVARDPKLVFDLRQGRNPRKPLEKKIRDYISKQGESCGV